jgi:hypothetical protein
MKEKQAMLGRVHGWVAGRIRSLIDQRRHNPDRGDESVNKILWAGVIVALVAIVGGIFRDTIVDAFNALQISLGFPG